MILAPLSTAYRMPRATTSSVPLVRRAEDVVPDAVDHLDRHDLDVERDAGRADVVVGELADRAADVRAVAVEIERHVVVPDEIARRDEPADGPSWGAATKGSVRSPSGRIEDARSSFRKARR